MKTMTELATSSPINEDLKIYDDVIQKLQEAKESNIQIEEGLFGAIFGGIAGNAAGPAIMKAIAKVLGIDEKGSLYALMTSKLTMTALGAYMGWKH
ncbi:MAG: hypothetical protein J6D03_00125 [Clostridia bacterium]|nr:hypothetical protein [Clostridia bacterium]